MTEAGAFPLSQFARRFTAMPKRLDIGEDSLRRGAPPPAARDLATASGFRATWGGDRPGRDRVSRG